MHGNLKLLCLGAALALVAGLGGCAGDVSPGVVVSAPGAVVSDTVGTALAVPTAAAARSAALTQAALSAAKQAPCVVSKLSGAASGSVNGRVILADPTAQFVNGLVGLGAGIACGFTTALVP